MKIKYDAATERRIIMKKIIVVCVLIALVMAGVLSGCKDVSADREKSNSVVVGISQDLDSLDPHNAAYAGTREVLFNMFEGLVKATSAGSVEPAVASDYVIAEDGMSIDFVIRDGVKFSDGTEVTAEDIIYSIERYAGIQGSESAFSVFKEITATDADHIRIVLAEPNTEFIYELTCAILPKANDANINSNPVGTGPFKYSSFVPGDKLVLVKNENYWKPDCPYLDQVTFKVVADTDTAVLQLNAGTLDVYQYLTADQAATVNGEKFNILEGSINYVQGMFLNNKEKPFDDIKVRQAVYYAVDRQLINDMIFAGKSHIIGSNMIPAAKAYYNDAMETFYTHDEEKAKELLKEAGLADGFEFTIKVPNNYAPHESTAQIIVECLAKVGITAKIELIEFNTWYSEVYVNRNYQATVVAVDGRLAPGSFFSKNVSTAVDNFTNYSNAEFDEVYAKALAETDLVAKEDYYKRLQAILAEDAASIYVQDPSNLVAVNSKLDGYVFYPISAQDMSVVKYK